MPTTAHPPLLPLSPQAPRWAATLALLVGIGLTVLATWSTDEAMHNEADLHFGAYAERVVVEIGQRVAQAEVGLRGARAMIVAGGGIDRDSFREYVAARELGRDFPGVRGLGLIERVPRADLTAFVERERADGAPGFEVRTAGSAPDLLVVRYIEPPNTTVGLDLGTDPVRRRALERAIASGEPTLSAPIELARDRMPGWLLCQAVYTASVPAASGGAPDDRLLGVLYLPMAADELLSTLPVLATGLVEFQLYDGSRDAGRLMYDGRRAAPQLTPQFDQLRPLTLGGRAVQVRITSTPLLEQRAQHQAVIAVAIAGTALSALLALAVLRLMRRHLQAQARAQAASADLARVAGGLADRERLIGLIKDSIPARLSYWDRELRCRLANRELAAAFGRPLEELIGMRFQDLLPPQRHPAALARARAALAGQAQRFEEGVLPPATSMVYYVPDDVGGEVQGFFVFALDITELKQAQEAAQRASAAKTQFLSNMSHEIRTPMNAVLGMLALLRMTPLDARQGDYAAKAEAAARSLLSLLNDVLDFSKIEAGKMALDPRPFSFRALLDDLEVILAATLGGKPIALRFDLDPSVPRLLVGDDMRLRQILINLGGNALKFTARGEVAVRVAQVAREAEHATVEVSVSDTGIGISAQDQQRIFADFSQAAASTTREFGGTGLGLSICSRLAALMGSALEVESEPGRGSRFHFRLRLPLAAEQPAGTAAAVSPATARPEPVLAGCRLLVVEDNPINQQVARELLEAAGAEVQLAPNGREAVLAVAASGLAPFDAVLMDLQMPVMDGYQATRDIRGKLQQRTLPIIAMTANAMDSDREQCRAAGMDDHVGKPFAHADLFATLLRHIRGAAPASTPLAPAPAPAGHGEPEPGAAPLIDRAGAIARLGGDDALYLRLVPPFREELRQALVQIQQLPGGMPRADATRLLHSLKGTSATLGATGLSAAAAAAERAARDEDVALDARVLEPLSQEIRSTLVAFDSEA